MRIKLMALGVGTQVDIYGQYMRVGSNNTILLCNVYEKGTNDYLCDHLWFCKQMVPYYKAHHDFVVARGQIYEYEKQLDISDYNIKPICCCLIRPYFYRDSIVFALFTERNVGSTWVYSRWYDIPAHNLLTVDAVEMYTAELMHLYDKNEEHVGYEIIAEDEEQYELWYAEKGSKIIVYKTLDTALNRVDLNV